MIHSKSILGRLFGVVTLCIAIAFSADVAFGQTSTPLTGPAAGLRFNVRPIYTTRLATASQEIKSKLEALQEEGKNKGWTFPVSYTGVFESKIESITGELPPTQQSLNAAAAINAQAYRVLYLYNRDIINKEIVASTASCNPSASSWDWSLQGKVTPVKRQSCGDCWAFASTAQIESAYLMAGWSQSDLAEQQVLSCSKAGDCGGGRKFDALSWATGTGVATEPQYPYENGVASTCKGNIVGSYKLLASGWVDSSGKVPNPDVLKQALCEFGPISVSILATPALQAYAGGGAVFNEQTTDPGTNHAILLVGWSDAKKAWLIKNSWHSPSSPWGDAGYAWIAYGSNNVGRFPVWAKAPHRFVPVSTSIAKEILQLKAVTIGQ